MRSIHPAVHEFCNRGSMEGCWIWTSHSFSQDNIPSDSNPQGEITRFVHAIYTSPIQLSPLHHFLSPYPSRPNQPIEQCPSQHKPTQSLHHPSRPKLPSPSEVSIPHRIITHIWRYAEDIYESTSEQCEEDVKQKSGVRFKTKDTSCNAKERCGEVVEG